MMASQETEKSVAYKEKKYPLRGGNAANGYGTPELPEGGIKIRKRRWINRVPHDASMRYPINKAKTK